LCKLSRFLVDSALRIEQISEEIGLRGSFRLQLAHDTAKEDRSISKKKTIKGKSIDNLLDALVWMRRKAKKRKPVDDLIDELISMRRKAKKKAAKGKGNLLAPRKPKPK
jgi:hypothetical protein